MSDQLLNRLVAFGGSITATPASADEGRIVATILAMEDEELRSAAEEVLGLAEAVDRGLLPPGRLTG